MIHPTTLTLAKRLILAADTLTGPHGAFGASFSMSSLIVAAWRQYPDVFGLTGYESLYPDSNTVIAAVVGVKGLAGRGWLVKTAKNRYAITSAGRAIIDVLTGKAVAPAPATRLPTDLDKLLAHLFACAAVQKFESGRKDQLTFTDAATMWGIAEKMTALQIDERLAAVQRGLVDLEMLLARGDGTMGSGRVVGGGDVRVLVNISRYIEDRYETHLNLMRNRTEKQRRRAAMGEVA